MGIISSLITEVAKDIALDVSLGTAAAVVDGVDKITDKRDAKKREKLLKTKKNEKSFIISFDEDEKSFWLNKTKARHYVYQDGEFIKYRIKRVVKTEGTSLVEIRTGDGKVVLSAMNEIIKKGIPVEHIYLISSNNTEIGRVFANADAPYRYVSSAGDAWDMIQNDKEFIVSKAGKAVANCKNHGLKLKKNSIAVTYNENEPEEVIFYLSLCLFFMLDKIGK